MVALIWLGIVVCLLHSAMFSGLNLAYFGISRLRLESEAASGSVAAKRVLELRQDASGLLATIIWGNVSINVLLTLLSDSTLTGAAAFVFSTVVITFGGEIVPQAYFSRNALKMGERFAGVFRLYKLLLSPVAWPTARLIDAWLGPEQLVFLREHALAQFIRQHLLNATSDVGLVEGVGALNFLAFDDLPVSQEGEPIHPSSIMALDFEDGRPRFPSYAVRAEDPFLQSILAHGKRWLIVVDRAEEPRLVLDTTSFLRAAVVENGQASPEAFCHAPVVLRSLETSVGEAARLLSVDAVSSHDDVIDRDVILVWAKERRIITGADLLGRLFRGIARRPAEK